MLWAGSIAGLLLLIQEQRSTRQGVLRETWRLDPNQGEENMEKPNCCPTLPQRGRNQESKYRSEGRRSQETEGGAKTKSNRQRGHDTSQDESEQGQADRPELDLLWPELSPHRAGEETSAGGNPTSGSRGAPHAAVPLHCGGDRLWAQGAAPKPRVGTAPLGVE